MDVQQIEFQLFYVIHEKQHHSQSSVQRKTFHENARNLLLCISKPAISLGKGIDRITEQNGFSIMATFNIYH